MYSGKGGGIAQGGSMKNSCIVSQFDMSFFGLCFHNNEINMLTASCS